jgi:hypothetical protein
VKSELELRVLKLQQLTALSQFLIALNSAQVGHALSGGNENNLYEHTRMKATEELRDLATDLWRP